MTADEIYTSLKHKLSDVVPDVELRYKAELACEINRLKKDRRAVVLGHNYMEPALYHSIPDFVGDSLELSRVAARTDAEMIVFCGVRFMAETAKILAPGKTVLIPSTKAGCSLADGITAEDVRNLKKSYPGVPVVTYVNTTAEVKAESDVCCTSSNAVKVVESLNADAVIFLPDEYLGRNVARETGREFVAAGDRVMPGRARKVVIGWRARCEVHEKFTVEDITNIRKQFPDVYILAHPECSPEVLEASDYSGSTTQMIRAVRESRASRYLLLTECAMGDNIAAENPGKQMLRLCSVRCPHMNRITLEDTLEALRNTQYVVEVPEDVRRQARRAVDRMLEVIPVAGD